MKDTNLNVNEYLPLRDVVFNTLRQAIITGEFAPGERLMEISLANRLGVSRTPVREAIRKLELEGLVIMIPRKGAQVAKITEKNLRDVIEIRTVLEEFATVLACERITQDGVIKLRQAHEDFIHAVEKGNILDIANKDEAFHDTIFQATNNDRLISIINNLAVNSSIVIVGVCKGYPWPALQSRRRAPRITRCYLYQRHRKSKTADESAYPQTAAGSN